MNKLTSGLWDKLFPKYIVLTYKKTEFGSMGGGGPTQSLSKCIEQIMKLSGTGHTFSLHRVKTRKGVETILYPAAMESYDPTR